MDRCVNHPNSSERVSIQDALRMATYNGYYTSMVILSANPYAIPASEIKNLRVEQLLLAGKPYQSAKEPLLKAVLHSLSSKNRF